MTTKPKARKFRIRGNTQPTPTSDQPFGALDDGFGDTAFPGSAKAEETEKARAAASQDLADIRREGLTGRELRMARRLAQKQGLTPTSDFDAVRLLRAKGIDPFDRANMLELVVAKPDEDAVANKTEVAAGGGTPPRAGLPQTVEPDKVPGPVLKPQPSGFQDMERIQQDIARRRRRRLMFLGVRLGAFVVLPTALAFIYFAFIATPIFATKSEFVVQQAEVQTGGAGGLLGGTSLATSQDSIMVQDFLTSREALLRLDDDHGYREHFSDPTIDSLQRIPADASNEAVYGQFKDNVKIGYDPTEGVIRMEVSALTPEMSRTFSEALIGYAEERVDAVTERKRSDQMRGARDSFEEAEAKMVAAQQNVLGLQEKLGVLDPASETSGLMGQINQFEVQMAEKRLQLQQLLDNARPNRARVAGAEGDIARLEQLIADLRSQLTVQGSTDNSLASISGQLRMAEVDLETRTMMMQETLQQMEAARIEANRQSRYLAVHVSPIPPDEPTYPRVFENTLIALLIFSAIYLMCSVTVAILREQVSS
ncbi:MAG: capsule biosynthesis protein [Silicimonas sp.]|nr:capsule biosynthesis protein [Silicimonas sp.]